MNPDSNYLEEIMLGATFLSGGGGGSMETGLEVGSKAMKIGLPPIIGLDQLNDEDMLATVSVVGPIGGAGFVGSFESNIENAVHTFMQTVESKIAGLIPSEVGPWAVSSAWYAAAVAGLPLVDAPCNGRAHPTGLMGSLGLHRLADYQTVLSAVGGAELTGPYLKVLMKGGVEDVSRLVRIGSSMAGLMAVIRNPVSVSYVRKNAGVGAIQQARQIGKKLTAKNLSSQLSVLSALPDLVGGEVLASGEITSIDLVQKDGFTVGSLWIEDEAKRTLQVVVCNEYMMIIEEGSNLAAFPDLITLIETDKSLPLLSTDAQLGMRAVVYTVPCQLLKLGSTMKERDLLRPVEDLLGMTFPD